MGLTLTNADAALKEDYEPAIREQLNNAFMILSQIEKTSKDVEGRRVVLSLHVTRNSGVGARAELGTLPTAGNQGYVEERVGMRYNYGRIQVSGPVMRAMKSDTGSFVRAVDSETKGVVTDLKVDVNRQIWGTSDGVIVGALSSAGQVITLDATATASQVRQLSIGMVIDVGTVANPTLRASAVSISAINDSNPAAVTVTVVGALGAVADTDFIFRAGAGGSGSSQKELTGLQTIVDDANSLFNVDPASYPVWKSYVDGASGVNRTPTETLFAKVAQQVNIRSGQDPDLWVTSDGVHRAFAANLQSQKRFTNTVDLKGGYAGLEINAGGVRPSALIWDKDAPNNKAFALSTPHLQQNQESEWEFMQEDGAVLSRVSGVDAYEATLFKYHEVTTDQRNAHGLIEDLSEL